MLVGTYRPIVRNWQSPRGKPTPGLPVTQQLAAIMTSSHIYRSMTSRPKGSHLPRKRWRQFAILQVKICIY